MKIFFKIVLILFSVNIFAQATLPDNIKWETNNEDPVFSSPKAKQGGVLRSYILSYPLTFRLYGPNSNSGEFTTLNRRNCSWGLINRHPDTLKPIPELATHWAVMDDNKTIYFKLNPNVKWNDGKAVTADDYLFANQMLRSEHLKAPFYKNYLEEKIEAIEKIDDYTLKIVGKYPSWRALFEYNFGPEPKHATKLNENWVRDSNWQKPVCVGPYYIDDYKRGKSIRYKRVKNWWGDNNKYIKNRYNFDGLDYKIISDTNLAFEHFKKQHFDYYVVKEPDIWKNQTNIEDIKNGKIIKRKIFFESPQQKIGIYFNLKQAVVNDKNFRKALQHLFDFEKINKNLFDGEKIRLKSFFEGTEYAKKDLKSYPYDYKKAETYLKKAGWIKRGSDGILINNKGERCSFTLSYGYQNHDVYLNIYKEDLKKAGIEMKLRLLDGAKFLKDIGEKLFQASLLIYGASYYPSPEQYLHSKYANIVNTNNLFSFSDKKVDKLLDIYEKELDFTKRLNAMHELEDIIKDEAIYIPFWYNPFYRVLFYNNLAHPDNYEPKLIDGFNNYMTWWFENDKPITDGSFKDINKVTDFDPHGVLKKK